MTRRILHSTLMALLGLMAGSGTPAPHAARGLPPIVFVSRQPAPDGQRPGLGPLGRTRVGGGWLAVRRPDGTVEPLLPPGLFHDVCDPSVSWDGKSVAFAATAAPDSAWRIYVANADGSGLRALTRTDRALDLARLGPGAERFHRYDDFDPCWLPNGRICFASTRYPLVAEEGVPVSNLWVVNADGSHPTRITSERHGGEEPTVDAETGRIVYARWWSNRHFASDLDPTGITLDPARAVPADSVDLWHAISITPDGDGGRLAGGHPRVRLETMAYQPIVLGDGTLVGVRAAHPALVPEGGTLSLLAFPRRFAPPRLLAGGGPGSACAPAALPDGRILFSLDPDGRGDFGLHVVDPDGEQLERVVDLPGTLELDAAVLQARRLPPVLEPTQADFPRTLPVMDERELRDSVTTFRFDCLNVFANGGIDEPFPDAPPLAQDLRIRFYASLARPAAAGGDTVILLREAEVTKSGAVHEHELPADTPMFEQLVDGQGRVLRAALGPAHVPGFNAGRYGHGTKCVGCHTGHSALPVALSAHEGKWFNVSPSAEVWASSVAAGNAGPRAAVDRRTLGPADQVAWIAGSGEGEVLRLTWGRPIELQAVVLYALSPLRAAGTDLRIRDCELAFFRGDREVSRSQLRRELSPRGTRLECGGIQADRLEVRPLRVSGTVHHRQAVALAEVETLARLLED